MQSKEEVNKIFQDAVNALVKKEYAHAAILFDKCMREGFLHHYKYDGETKGKLFFYAYLANFYCDNKEAAKELFTKLVYEDIDYIRLTPSISTNKDEKNNNIFNLGSNTKNEAINKIEVNLFYYTHNSYFKKLAFELIPKWWQKIYIDKTISLQNPIGKTNITASQEPIKDMTSVSKLNNLVGLNTVKEEVKKLISVAKIRQLRKERGLEITPQTLHMVFTGNPGTGKTTVARILAEVFKEIGLLSKGQLIETDRANIVEKYVGHTAQKVKELVQAAKGGILFIDEAYSLSKEDNPKDFGQEAIDTLVKLMEDNREDLVIIVAGYPKEMQSFLSSNTGLKSRFSYYIEFDDYDSIELLTVFKNMCESKGYIISGGVLDKVKELIDLKKANDPQSFGNARGVRNIFEKIEINQMSRLGIKSEITNEELMTIAIVDIP